MTTLRRLKNLTLIAYALWAAPIAKKYPKLERILLWPVPK